jgi:hypothetical protein
MKKQLPDDYTVFHGIHWSREYAKWTHFGEVDFVIVNPSGDVLLIEQKDGAFAETDAGLVKEYEGDGKNVNDQTRRSVDKIKEKFKWQHGNVCWLAVDYLVYRPDHRVVGVDAAALDTGRFDTLIVDEGQDFARPIWGDDADTTAAVCDQVAGAHYGKSGIPGTWLE